MTASAEETVIHLDGRFSRVHFSPPSASFRLYGYFDGVHGRCVDGWLFDAASPESQLMVEIYDDATLLGSANAGLFRADLEAIGIASGGHAFRFELPAAIFDGTVHQIWVRVKNSGLALPGSPRHLATQRLDEYVPSASPYPASPPTHEQAVLSSLHAITEALLAQTRLLQTMVAHFASAMPAVTPVVDVQAVAPEPGPSAISEASPVLSEVLACPTGQHDYLIFAIIDWGFRTQRPQHLATRLAILGNRVFYISIQFHEQTKEGPRFVVSGQPAEGVFEISLCCQAPAPIVYSGFTDPGQLAQLAEAVRSMANLLSLRSPVCILQLPTWYPVAASIPGATLLFDCLDHLAGFSTVSPSVIELEHTLIECADSVIVTSNFLADAVGGRRRIDVIRNGVDVAHFSRRPDIVFQGGGDTVIGYYGAISDWFDIDLVIHCARRHPKWRFVLIGAVDSCDVAEASQLPNISFLGERPYQELPHYLYGFDVCMIPFKLQDLTRATNPVKVYEYLCAGKPVVATDLPELRRLPSGMVELARSTAEFDRALVTALRQKDPDLTRRRKQWAARHSWDVRVRKLAGVVARNYPPVSVIVLCYNNLTFTSACLQSLLAFSDYPDLEIICVDNASTDGTAEYLTNLARQYASVHHLRCESNLGFAGGNNIGIRAARGDFVVLLNNDTYVTQGWLRDLIRPLQRDQSIAITGPLTNMAGNEQKIAIAYSSMQEMARASAAFTAARRYQIYPTGNLAFFCVAIRRTILDTVGGLDEGYGTGYFEDDDYCMRVRKAGHRLVICDDVFVHHHHSASFDQLGDTAKSTLMKRNRRIFEKRWGPWTPHGYREAPGFGEI